MTVTASNIMILINRIDLITMDVTDQSSIDSAVETVSAKFPKIYVSSVVTM